MNVNHIKQLFVALFLLLSAGTATAAHWQLAKAELNTAGSKDTLVLGVYGNSFDFSSFQVDFTLPEGVLPDGAPVLGGIVSDHELTWRRRDDGSYRCVVYSASNAEMKAPEGDLLRIPVALAASFTEGTFTAKNGILSNKKSEGMNVSDKDFVVASYKEKANLVVNVSGLEQRADVDKAAELGYTTIPVDKTLTVEYFKDAECKTAATDADRKREGVLYVKLSFAGDEDYNAFEQVYTLVLTGKLSIDVTRITLPTAADIKEGQLLSSSLLSGGNVKDGDYEVAGTFAWTDGNIAVPAGENNYSVTFYPDNSSYYNTAEVSVRVKAIATYTITTAASTGGVANVLGKTEDNKYVSGQEITLQAIPQPNYRFDGWSVTGATEILEKKDTICVTADANKTYYANFSPILHKVTIAAIEGNGRLSVTTAGETEVNDGESLQQGTTLQLLATPGMNARLKELTINGDSLKGDKVTLTEALTIKVVFEAKPVDLALVTIQKAANGSILLYKEDGSPIASGSTVPVGSKVRVIALPDAGYQLDGSVELSNVTPSDGLYTVKGDIMARAVFTTKRYKVTASAVSGNPSETKPAGTITLEPAGDQPYGTKVRITDVRGEAGARLLTILANGKEVSRNDVLTVTGDLTVTAVFDHRVDIEKEYILWPYQEFYYNGVSRNFVPFASQTYAGFSFDVKYKDSEKNEIDKAIDADEYTVLLHRDEDGLYNEFNEEYAKGLVIKQSKITVTEAPKNGGNPKTRPGESDVTITSSTTSGVTKYVIEPKSETAKKNYVGAVYYHSTLEDVPLSFGSILRSGEEPHGAVRVTNGGLPYDVKDGKVSIPGGITVTLEAVPNTGYTFSKWSDGNTENPREYEVTAEAKGVTPIFEGKATPSFQLSAASSDYNGTAQTVSVTGDGDETCQISFFFDEDCTQPAILKNTGTYYVRVYRPEDDRYKAYENTFKYTINPVDATVKEWPVPSDILSGHALAESVLQGGHAGIVAGTFAWSDPTAVVTETVEHEVVFTPTDPNYKLVRNKIEVKVVSATASSTDPEHPETPVDPVDPSDPVNPDNPTGVESIEENMALYAANRYILADLPRQTTLTVINVAGVVVYQETVTGEVMIPVGHAGVYFVRCEAANESLVRKIVVH